jgi:hypothetical protein
MKGTGATLVSRAGDDPSMRHCRRHFSIGQRFCEQLFAGAEEIRCVMLGS